MHRLHRVKEISIRQLIDKTYLGTAFVEYIRHRKRLCKSVSKTRTEDELDLLWTMSRDDPLAALDITISGPNKNNSTGSEAPIKVSRRYGKGCPLPRLTHPKGHHTRHAWGILRKPELMLLLLLMLYSIGTGDLFVSSTVRVAYSPTWKNRYEKWYPWPSTQNIYSDVSAGTFI